MAPSARVTSKAKLPLVGAQLSTAGGFAPVPRRALDIGAEAVQIFNTNPRMWRARVPAPGEIEALTAGLRKHRLRLFFHSIYLINLASADDELRRRSLEALALALATGAAAGAEAVVTHIGSHRGEAAAEAKSRIVQSITDALSLARHLAEEQAADAAHPPNGRATAAALPVLLLETAAGAGNTVGDRLEDIAALIAMHDSGRKAALPALGICIDTAHLFAAGYPVHEEAGLEKLVAELRALRLLDRLGLVHLNDSRTPFASRRDFHENLGDGLMGYEALGRVVRHPAFAHVPFVLEVPGGEGRGPDAVNVALAKRMRAGLPRPLRRPRAGAVTARTPQPVAGRPAARLPRAATARGGTRREGSK